MPETSPAPFTEPSSSGAPPGPGNWLGRLWALLGPGRFGRHVGLSVAQIGLETAFRTVAVIVLAPLLGPEMFGRFAVILAGISLLQMLAEGFWSSLTKHVPERRVVDERLGLRVAWWASIASHVLCLGLTLLVLGALYLFQNEYARANQLDLWLAAAGAFFLAARCSVEAALRGLKNFSLATAGSAIFIFLQSAAMILVAMRGYRVTALLVILAATGAAHFLAITAAFYWRFLRGGALAGPIPWEAVREVLLYARYLVLRGFVYFFFLRVNVILVRSLAGETQAGYFALAERFFLAPMLVIGGFVNALAPRVTERRRLGDQAAVQRLIERSYGILLLLMAPFVVIFLGSSPIVRWLFPAYIPAIPALWALAPALVFKALGGLSNSALLIQGGFARAAFRTTLLSAVLNVTGLWLFAGRWGAVGAACSTMLAHSLSAVLVLWLAHRNCKVRFAIRLPWPLERGATGL